MQAPALFLAILLSLLRWGMCTLDKLETEHAVRCTEGLLCEKYSIGGLCMPGDKFTAQGHKVVPTSMRTSTILHCLPGKDCRTCVRVEVNLSIEYFPELESGDDYDGEGDFDEEQPDEDEDEFTAVSSAIQPHPLHNNSLYTRTRLFFSQVLSTQMCVEAVVQVPRSFLQQSPDLRKVGTVIFDCFTASPKEMLRVKIYTNPRYQEELSKDYIVPGCEMRALREEVRICEVPKVNIFFAREVVVQILNGSKERPYHLMLQHNNQSGKLPHSVHRLTGGSNHTISYSDIVPCLCIEAWLIDYQDAVRSKRCPFEKMPEYQKNTWRKSNLTLTNQTNRLTWEFTALCNVSAEITLCWKPSHESACHDIPHSRREIKVYVHVMQEFLGIVPHPHLCVQVRGDEKIWHTNCPYKDSSVSSRRSSTLVMITQHSQSNISLCVLEGGACVPLSKSTSMHLQKADLLEKQLLKDVMAGNKCEKVWIPNGNLSGAVLLCSLDYYVRGHWAMAWVACILSACCILLLLMIKNNVLKGWIHFLKADYSSSGLFHNRRALLLYSPDHDVFNTLIGTLASALSELQLAVVVDLWHRSELDAVGPMQWFHRQRLQVIEDSGIIVLLFSKGALATCNQWLGSEYKMQASVSSEDPRAAFATSLNCVLPDFLEGRCSGRYVVACFEELFNHRDIPQIFQSVPVFPLPSQLTEFLAALSGERLTILKKRLLKGDSGRISDRLQHAIKQCQKEECTLPSRWADSTSEASSSDYSRDSLELHLLL